MNSKNQLINVANIYEKIDPSRQNDCDKKAKHEIQWNVIQFFITVMYELFECTEILN